MSAEKETHLKLYILSGNVYSVSNGYFSPDLADLGVDGSASSVQQATSDYIYVLGEDDTGSFFAKYKKIDGTDDENVEQSWRIHGVDPDAYIGFCDTQDPVLASSGALTRYDSDTASEIWTVDPGESVSGVATLSSRDIAVAVDSPETQIREFERTSGDLVNEISTVSQPTSVTRDDENQYVVYHDDGVLRKYDRDGGTLWNNSSVGDSNTVWRDHNSHYYLGSGNVFGGSLAIVGDDGVTIESNSFPFSNGASSDAMPRLVNGNIRVVYFDDSGTIVSRNSNLNEEYTGDMGANGVPDGSRQMSIHPRFSSFPKTWGVVEEPPEPPAVVKSATASSSTQLTEPTTPSGVATSAPTSESPTISLPLSQPSLTTRVTPDSTPAAASFSPKIVRRIFIETADVIPPTVTFESNTSRGDVTVTPVSLQVGSMASTIQPAALSGKTALSAPRSASSSMDTPGVVSTVAPSTTKPAAVSAPTMPQSLITVTSSAEGFTDTSSTSTATVGGTTTAPPSSVEADTGLFHPSTIRETPVPESRFRFGFNSYNDLCQYDDDGNVVKTLDIKIDPDVLEVDSEGNLYMHNGSGILASYNSDGVLRWETDVSNLEPTIALDDDGGVFVIDYLGEVDKYDSQTGDLEFFSTDRVDGSPVGLTADGYGGVYVTTESAGGDGYFARINLNGDLVSQRSHFDSDGVSAPIRAPNSDKVTYYAGTALRQVDGTDISAGFTNSTTSLGNVDTDVEPQIDDDGAMYFILDEGDRRVKKYTWANGTEWEASIDSEIVDSIDVTSAGSLYISYSDIYRLIRLDTADASTVGWFDNRDVRLFEMAFFPDYPANSDGWGDIKIASASGKGITRKTTTQTPSGSGFSGVSGDGATATGSSTTGSATAGLTPTVETTVSAPTPTMPATATNTASSVEGDTISSTTLSTTTPTVDVDMTAVPVAGGTTTTVPVEHATSASGATRTTGATTLRLPIGTVSVLMEAMGTTTRTPVPTPSVVSQTVPSVASKAVQTTSCPNVGALEGFSADAVSLAVQSTMFGAETLLDAVRAMTLDMSTTAEAPTTDATTSRAAISTSATIETPIPIVEAIIGVYSSGAISTPTLDPVSGRSGVGVSGSLVSTPVALSAPQTMSGVEPLAVPVLEATASLSPSVGTLCISQASHVDTTVSTVVPNGTTGATIVSQLYNALATPLVPFGYDPRLAGPTTDSNQLQSRDSSNSASLSSSQNQSDIVDGSNSSTLNVSTNEIDVEVTE